MPTTRCAGASFLRLLVTIFVFSGVPAFAGTISVKPGAAYTDSTGVVWSSDSSNCSGGVLASTSHAIIGALPAASDQALYQPERYRSSTCTFTAPAGTYAITIKFTENYWSSAGSRLFGVSINGVTVLSAFDIFAAAGGQYIALDKTFLTTTTGSPITIQFINGSIDFAKYDSIQIVSTGPAPAPGVTSVSPTSALQGQAIPVVITGSNFQIGATCSFSAAGITVNSCIFNSATKLTANISISSTATLGAGNVTVTNPDAQSNTLTNAFTVTQAPAPAITSVSPISALQGQAIPVVITGSNFQSGATCSFSATGITVSSCAFNSATQLTANISIAATATLGAGNVTVTNPDTQIATLPAAFSVTQAPAPGITSVSPTTGLQGQVLPVVITGSNFQSGATCSFSATGITVSSCVFISATQLTANLSIAASATLGAGNVTVTNPDTQSATLPNVFTVNPPPPFSPIRVKVGSAYTDSTGALWSSDSSNCSGGTLSPTSHTITGALPAASDQALYQGERYGNSSCTFNAPPGTYNVTLKFVEKYWNSAGSRLFAVTINGVTVLSEFDIFAAAGGQFIALDKTFSTTTTGSPITIQFINGSIDNAKYDAIQIVSGTPPLPPPVVTSVNPTSAMRTQALPVVITGSNFLTGATCSFSAAGITLNSCVFNSATQMTANISIALTATLGAGNVTVTNPDTQIGTLPNGFTLTPAPAPGITSVSPTSGIRGQALPVVITGSNFLTGASCSFSAAGITVSSCVFNSASQMTANISIAATATLGAGNVTVTNTDAQSGTLPSAFTVNPAPTPGVASVSPTSAIRGQALPVVITGSNFLTGATCSFSATGITVSSCVFNSATQLTANISLSTTATLGAGNVTVTNPDAQIATLPSAFTVNPIPPPGITSINPTSGIRGQAFPVVITGTNFQSGATCSFSATGITVSSCVFNSATQLTANISMSTTATLGAGNVTVTNPDAQAATLPNGFTVNPIPPPGITSLSPTSGMQTQAFPVVITGSNFQSGATCSFSATGITVSSCVFNSVTQLTANISIAPTATLGAGNVTVTNPDAQTVTLPSAFTVTQAPAPGITSVNPTSGLQSQTLPVVITGSNFQTGATCSFSAAGITVSSCVFNSATQMTANISISSTATLGAGNVTVTNVDTQSGTLTNGFTVNAPPPFNPVRIKPGSAFTDSNGSLWSSDASNCTGGTLSSTSHSITGALPAASDQALYQSERYGNSTCTFNAPAGTYTITLKFAEKYWNSAGARIFNVSINGVTVLSAFDIFAAAGGQYIAIDKTFLTTTSGSPITIQFINGSIDNAKYGAIQIVLNGPPLPPPAITSVNPTSGMRTQALPVVITGSNFLSGTTCSFSGAGITVNSCVFNSATQLTANISISGTAPLAAGNVMVTNPDAQNVTLPNAFTVTPAPAPGITSLSPAAGMQTQTLPVVITGSNFQNGATCSFSTGITVNSCLFNSVTQLTANISVSATTTLGTKNVTVTNPDSQSAILPNAFTVNPAPAPTVASVSPVAGIRGQALAVAINGSNFQSGATCSFSASGITVSSCVFNSATQLTANISIASTATLGAKNVTVTNPDTQNATLANAFTVNQAPAPGITSVSPTSGVQAQAYAVVITGSNFQSGATCSFSASGITVSSCVFNSATQLTANITIFATATLGAGNVTVTNPDTQSATLPNAFTVIQPSPGFITVNVKAGAAYTDSTGTLWSSDTANCTGGTLSSTSHAITGALPAASDQALYQPERYGNSTCTFNAPAGTYNITLKFVEKYWTSAGSRIFNVSINGTPVLSAFDIFAAAGGQYIALDKTFSTTTTGSPITIQFTNGSVDNAKYDAIQIVLASIGPPATVNATAGTPQFAVINTPFATALQATVTDANSNRVSGVSVTFTAPSTGASGTFPGAATVANATTNNLGIATAPTFTANSTAGPFAVTASVPGATSANYNLTTGSQAVSVTISPKRGGITINQSLPVSATVLNDSTASGVTWSATGSGCSGPSCGTFVNVTPTSATYIAPSTPGTYSITATSNLQVTSSDTSTIGVTDLSGVFTYHNNLSRDGTNTHEFALTTSNVNTSVFGKLFSCQTDGAIYAQPLWVSNLTVAGAPHNVVIVATQHDSLYAFDADAPSCTVLWSANLIDSTHGGTSGETPVPTGKVGTGAGDVSPEIGVLGTPVIDPITNILYVVSKSVNGSSQFFQRLHAIDLTTGKEVVTPSNINSSISVAGTGDGSVSGRVAFDPRNENQRPGLVLSNGVVYVSWAAHEDKDPYHGWLIGFNASTLARVAVFNTTPNSSRGGIWMSGGAPSVDSSGNLFLSTGNGTFNVNTGGSDYGDSVMKLSTASGLSVADYFAPSNQSFLNGNDLDLGAGGPSILVDQPGGPVTHLIIGGGKNSSLFLLNRDNMGTFSSTTNNVVQTVSVGNQIYGTPVFWQNNLYIAASNGALLQYAFNTSTGKFGAPVSQSTTNYRFPGATPSLSSNGATNGIVWALENGSYCTAQSPSCGPTVLHAYDATNLATDLWNSSQAAGNRDQAGDAVKFTLPTVANGKVYVGTRGNNGSVPGELDVYGLLPN